MISYKFKKFLVYCNKFYSKLHAVKSSLETDILAKKIVTKLLSKPDTVYLMSPSGRYYLQTGDKRFFVVISDNFIKITKTLNKIRNIFVFHFTFLKNFISQNKLLLVSIFLKKKFLNLHFYLLNNNNKKNY